MHAELRWTGEAWALRDKNSLNGTSVNGKELLAHQTLLLKQGDKLAFGSSKNTLQLVDASPPQLAAQSASGARLTTAPDGMLSLPTPEAPECQVFIKDGGWVIERGGEQDEVSDQQSLQLQDESWRLELPPVSQIAHTVPQTREVKTRLLADVTLRFQVSSNMTYIGLLLQDGDWEKNLDTRAFNETLFVLAKLRKAQEAKSPQDKAAHGWILAEKLLVKAAVGNLSQLNQYVFRARRKFQKAGIVDAARLVERRRVVEVNGIRNELRLGTHRIVVDEV